MPYGGNPSTDIDDAIRFLVGDTDATDPLLSDDELTFLRDTYGEDPYRVAAEAATSLAGKYSRYADQKVGRVEVDYSQLSQQYRDLAAELRRRIGASATPYAAGISLDDIETEREDDDRPSPIFIIGIHDEGGDPLEEDIDQING